LFVFKEKYHSMNSLSYTIKRLFDIVFSLFVIVFILSWLLPILAIIILFDTKAMPVFVQERVGKNGVHFNCFKLRSMIKNQDAHRLAAQENDARITKIGGFLRKYAIDELPQFFNVLFGQMSIVGPRPLMIFEEKKFNELVPNFSARLTRRPGITGLAQSYGYKGMVYDLADIRIRMRLDMMYDLKQSLWLDIKLIGNTIYYLVKQIGR
jgi:putative colanic acid biosysnthesis UDP-glucose lipid carrier transferase